MGGVFRRPFHRIPRKKLFLPGGPFVPTVQVPIILRNPAVLRNIALRPPRIRRRAVAPPLLGVRPRAPIIPVARMLRERFRKMMRQRRREVFVPTIPVPAAVGPTPFPMRPPAQIKPAIAARARAGFVPTFPPVAVGPTPFPSRPPSQRRPVVARARPPTAVPTFPPAAVGPTVFIKKPPLRRPSVTVNRVRPLVPTGPFVPGVPGPTPFRVRQPAHPRRAFLRPPRLSSMPRTAPSSVIVLICSTGVWSVEVFFEPCETYRMELRGPACNDVSASVAIEFVDPDA